MKHRDLGLLTVVALLLSFSLNGCRNDVTGPAQSSSGISVSPAVAQVEADSLLRLTVIPKTSEPAQYLWSYEDTGKHVLLLDTNVLTTSLHFPSRTNLTVTSFTKDARTMIGRASATVFVAPHHTSIEQLTKKHTMTVQLRLLSEYRDDISQSDGTKTQHKIAVDTGILAFPSGSAASTNLAPLIGANRGIAAATSSSSGQEYSHGADRSGSSTEYSAELSSDGAQLENFVLRYSQGSSQSDYGVSTSSNDNVTVHCHRLRLLEVSADSVVFEEYGADLQDELEVSEHYTGQMSTYPSPGVSTDRTLIQPISDARYKDCVLRVTFR